MDEIDWIRNLRANLPSVRADKREAARAALLERIEAADGQASRRGPLGIPVRRAGLFAAAVGALGVAIAVPALLLGGSETGVPPAAAKVLRQVADVAASRSPEAPGPGRYLFTRSKEAHLVISFREGGKVAARDRARFMRIWHTRGGMPQHPWWVMVPEERELLLGPDGSGRLRQISGAPSFLSARQRAAWVAAGSPPLPRAGRVNTEWFGRHGLGGLFFSRLAQLPTKPRPLRRWIETHDVPGKGHLSAAGTTSTGVPAGKPGHAAVFGAIGFLLGESFAPAKLRAALYRAASELPGVQLLGTVTDPIGRRGIGVAYTDRGRGVRLELIFDRRTSALLGEQDVVTSPRRSGVAAPAGTVFGYTAHLASRVVGSAAFPVASASQASRP